MASYRLSNEAKVDLIRIHHMKTKENNNKKTFDAVKFMREQRDRISKEIMDLSPKEIVAYFEKKTKKKGENPAINREDLLTSIL